MTEPAENAGARLLGAIVEAEQQLRSRSNRIRRVAEWLREVGYDHQARELAEDVSGLKDDAAALLDARRQWECALDPAAETTGVYRPKLGLSPEPPRRR